MIFNNTFSSLQKNRSVAIIRDRGMSKTIPVDVVTLPACLSLYNSRLGLNFSVFTLWVHYVLFLDGP